MTKRVDKVLARGYIRVRIGLAAPRCRPGSAPITWPSDARIRSPFCSRRRSSALSKLKGDDAGVFIALDGFTRNAEMEARAYERRCVLLDGADFVRLWIEHHDRLDEEARALLRLRPIWRLVLSVD